MTIELNASPEVTTYLGGPRPRAELERALPGVPGQRPGFFAVERYQGFGAEQWFGVWTPVTPPA